MDSFVTDEGIEVPAPRSEVRIADVHFGTALAQQGVDGVQVGAPPLTASPFADLPWTALLPGRTLIGVPAVVASLLAGAIAGLAVCRIIT